MLPQRVDNSALLTPDNRYVFLYDWTLYAAEYSAANLGQPIITADWNVYLKDKTLVYTSAECAHWNERFLLHFVPRDLAVLPEVRKGYGHDNRNFGFGQHRAYRVEGRCVIEQPRPEYDISVIRTGQFTDAGRIWEGEYRLPAP